MMETIKVNMTPCEDVQTIHASQNDNEAREWGFELHNNGEKIDSSSISDQLVFKAYEGGTEELLPSSLMNGSVDLGSLAWTYMPNNYFRSTSVISDAKIPSNENTVANIFCSILKPNTANNVYANNEGIAIDGTGRIRIYYDDMPTDVTSFTQAMQGVLLWYEKSDSTPTTTPFLGDIKYPQGLLTDQEFTYRESPTESDGLAKITDIKGNTIVWNQLANSSSYATGTYSNVAVTKSTDETYLIANGTASANAYIKLFNIGSLPTISGHMYCCVVPTDSDVAYYDDTSPRQYNNQYSSFVFTSNGSPIRPYARIVNGVASTNRRISFMMFDLTQMGLDISSPSDFTSLFPLLYYAYNQGTLLSFMGNGIKTTNADETEESTLSLPISTYFPNGMKSKGTVYDELTESKAITRIGSRAYQSGDESDTSVITDGTTTYYVLATPTETSFTTASLVTENAEIPLSNEDGVLIGKCTEQLSENPGFFDAKIKLSDADGECYSNKIQLHVERSPQ